MSVNINNFEQKGGADLAIRKQKRPGSRSLLFVCESQESQARPLFRLLFLKSSTA